MPLLPSQAEIERTLKGFAVPPRPQVLVSLGNEMAKDEPDSRLIAHLISGDVGLSGAVLKMANSPFFGRSKKIGSIANAVTLLGTQTVAQIVTGLMLRNTLAGGTRALERFWNSAEQVAGIAAHIASSLPHGARDEAYSFGLFHNAGIPLLIQRFPDYLQTLEMATEAGDRSITELEDERHAVNHATLGYLIAKAWFLPPAICEGILRHHDPSIFDDNDSISPQALTLIAITCLAEHFSDDHLLLGSNAQWNQMGEMILRHLGLPEADYQDLKEQVAGMMI